MTETTRPVSRPRSIFALFLLLLAVAGFVGWGIVSPPGAKATIPAIQAPSVANLVAFARLYGYVRYFHPSDEAAGVEWNLVAINGAKAVRDISEPADLARALETFFRPIAPTVRVFPLGEWPPLPEELSLPQGVPDLQVVTWQHYLPDTYESGRLWQAAPGGEIPPGFHDPRQPFYAELGGGVAALVPLALYVDAEGTLPHTAFPPAESPDRDEPYDEQARRVAGVVIAWNHFQHLYPYFDVIDTDWFQVLEDSLAEAVATADEGAYFETLQRLIARLQDGHGSVTTGYESLYYTPPLLPAWVEDHLVVLSTLGQPPGGLQRGDIILSIDGRPAKEAIAEVEELISGATPQWKRFWAVQRVLAGPQGSQVRLEVQTPAGERRKVTLSRTAVRTPGLLRTALEPRPETIEEIEPGIFYIDLGRLTDRAFEEVLPQLVDARGIVFDVRGYPAGFLSMLPHIIDEQVLSPQLHLSRFIYPDHQNPSFEMVQWPVDPSPPRLTDNLVFLTDGRAVSAAETLMGIVEHYRLAEIVGEPTAGTNGVVRSLAIPGYTFKWTSMKVLKHDGSLHHGVGIQPTVYVPRTIQGVTEGRDEQLERAIEILRQGL